MDNNELEKRMEKQIADCSFWMQEYTKSFKDNDEKLGVIDSQMNGKMETLEYQIGQRVTINDMTKNFEKLTDILLIKFSQVEDNKQAVRDMLNY